MVRGNVISVVATILIAIGITSAAYIHFQEEETTAVTAVGAHIYTMEDIFGAGEEKTIGNYTGVALDDVFKMMNLKNPEAYNYTIFSSDGNDKSISWTNATQVLLTNDGLVIFSDLGWIKDVTMIKTGNRSLIIFDAFVEKWHKTIEIDHDQKKNFTGIPFDTLIEKIGVREPAEYAYTFIAVDKYKKTVRWEDARSGIIVWQAETKLKVVLPDLPKAFWVHHLFRLEVKHE